MNKITEMIEPIHDLGNLKLTVEYSAGSSTKEIEFESIQVSEDNNLPLEKRKLAEKFLENGLEEELVRKLAKHYQGTDIVFLPNHYEIS